MNLMMVTAIQAVVRTMETDRGRSSALLRRLLEPAHLAAHGHEELPWLAREIGVIAKVDPDLAVDIYEAAYGYEDPDGTTPVRVGDSQILGLTSNRRQDYQSAWFALSEALPDLLRADLALGVRAAAKGIRAYAGRAKTGLSVEPIEAGEIDFGGVAARCQPDRSYNWFRGGFQLPQDGPALFKKFDDFLTAAAAGDDADATVSSILAELEVSGAPAAFWASLLLVAAHNPALAPMMVPLVCAPVVLTGWDTRPAAGDFLEAAYGILSLADRQAIERAILGLAGKAGEDAKKRLAGTLPEDFLATPEIRNFREALTASGEGRPNTPITQMSTSWRAFDTEAYLESEGVDTSDPENADLRDALTRVESLPPIAAANELSPGEAGTRISTLEALLQQIEISRQSATDPKLFELAEGRLAEGAALIARLNPKLLKDGGVRRRLETILLATSRSDNPHLNLEVEADFNENLSWGGPSARTSSADGLIRLAAAGQFEDPELGATLHRLVRDPVCHVRLHIVQNLNLLAAGPEAEWMWSELEHVITEEPTRGVVAGAVEAISALASTDGARAIALAKAVMNRYAGQSDPGCASVAALVATFLADLYIWDDQPEADAFFAERLTLEAFASDQLGQWLARYSGYLLAGDLGITDTPPYLVRQKTLDFYNRATDVALARIAEVGAGRGLQTFGEWSEEDQSAVRAAYDVVSEVCLRLSFALGAHAQATESGHALLRERLYREGGPLLDLLADTPIAKIAHDLIQGLQAVIEFDPAGVFARIAKCIRASSRGGYQFESMAANLVVGIVERYLAEHRDVFAQPDRLNDLVDALDIFARAGWSEAQVLTFRLAEIWR
jgi:hypothetical protein